MIIRITIFFLIIVLYSCIEDPGINDILKDVPKGDLLYSGSATIARIIGEDSLLIYAKIISQIPYGEHIYWFVYDYKKDTSYDLFYPPNTTQIDYKNGNTIFASNNKSILVTSQKDTVVFTEINNPSFNYDGSAFVYCNRYSIYTYTIKDKSTKFVYQTDSSTYPRYPCWVGDKIYFEADSEMTSTHIYEVNSSGGQAIKLTFGYVRDTHPRGWGEYVAFSRLFVYPNQILINKGSSTIYSYSGNAYYPELIGDTLFYCSKTDHENGINVYVSKWK